MVVKIVTPIPQQDARTPSTVFYGLQLAFPSNDITGWVTFMKSLVGQRIKYSQLRLRGDNEIIEEDDLLLGLPIHLKWATVAQDEMVMLKGGHDPIAGYYLQFAGHTHLFTQPGWWLDEETF
jgi:hypothetical protein